MRKVIKKILKVLLIAALAVLVGVFIYNRIMLEKESVYFDNPPGQMVEIDGHNMHIYTEGEGEHTFVLLSGYSTPNPLYDFEPLCKELSADNRVVVVERFGYGFSDIVDGERDFDTILRQDKEALSKAGIEGPYILCPHSLAGVEAQLWAQKYPEDIEAIVGLDMTVAMEDFYPALMTVQRITNGILRFVRWSGLIRFKSMEERYSAEEKKINSALYCRNGLNKTVDNEIKYLDGAMEEILGNPLPTVATIQFISSQNVSTSQSWEQSHREIVDASTNGKLVVLDCGHYVHAEQYEKIASEVNDFLKSGL